MKLIDLNLLLYAVNEDSVHHAPAKSWLERVLSNDEEPVAFTWPVLLGFLRLSTSSKIFPNPLSPEQAIEVINGWLARQVSRILEPGEDHWRLLRSLLEECGTAGNLTTDAHLAALAIENGCELCSTDSDFTRFPRLKCRNPLREASRS